MFVEGPIIPSAPRENGEAVAWRVVRMMQRGVLIGFDDPSIDLQERTLRFIDRFAEEIESYPRVMQLLLDAPDLQIS